MSGKLNNHFDMNTFFIGLMALTAACIDGIHAQKLNTGLMLFGFMCMLQAVACWVQDKWRERDERRRER